MSKDKKDETFKKVFGVSVEEVAMRMKIAAYSNKISEQNLERNKYNFNIESSKKGLKK